MIYLNDFLSLPLPNTAWCHPAKKHLVLCLLAGLSSQKPIDPSGFIGRRC